jgi:uncharacterized protein YkwD
MDISSTQPTFTVATASSTITPSQMEQAIMAEMNRARANPQAYTRTVLNWRRKFQGHVVRIGDRAFLQTQEGTAAVDEAVNALQHTAPAPELEYSKGLSLAARDHLTQGTSGATGHKGVDGSTPFQRMARYGKFQRIAAENIAYGSENAEAVVRDLIIDDGVPDRGHRTTMFRPQYRVAGVACGPHARYRVFCVIKYADGYREY